jgi:pyridoxamine 5'-phosphate oxidase
MGRKKLIDLRTEYHQRELNETDIDKNPFKQFDVWFNEAVDAKCYDPNAMALATSTFEGKPSVRLVLLKMIDERGLAFFTNYDSKKSRQILQNPFGAVVFFWPELERQIRIEGKIVKSSDSESDLYFRTRPEASKIGAWASPQSQVIPNRRYLEQLQADFREEFNGKTIKRPPNWGGYRLVPSIFEFWQGRANRLHDRIQYSFTNNVWVTERLAP